MKIKKFEVNPYGERELISEIIINSDDLIEKEILFRNNKPVSVSTKFYDASKNLIEDRLEENGVTSHKYIYNPENRVINEQVFFGDSLYEEVSFVYQDDVIVEKTVVQDGDMVNKMRREVNGKEIKVLFLDDNNELTSWNKIVELSDLESECFYYDENNDLMLKDKRIIDSDGNIIELTEFNAEGDVLEMVKNEYQEGKQIKSVNKKFHFDESYEVEIEYSYNPNGDIEKYELRDITGNLIQSKHYKYNKLAKIVDEILSTSHSHDVITGIFNLGQSYHYIYEYENA